MAVKGDGKHYDKNKGRWAAGVTPYKELGYWKPDYEPKASDIL